MLPSLKNCILFNLAKKIVFDVTWVAPRNYADPGAEILVTSNTSFEKRYLSSPVGCEIDRR